MSDNNGYVPVMPEDQVKEGELYPFELDGEEMVITRVDGKVFAVHGICTHEYAQLCDGELEDETLWCPLHSSGFNIRTGEATNLPAVDPLPTYDVRIEGGQIHVARAPNAPTD